MEVILVLCLFLSHWIIPSLCGQEFQSTGGEVTFDPRSSAQIKSVLWKIGNDKVIELDPNFGEDVTVYGRFKNRAYLNKTRATLTITKLTTEDSGIYTVEINNIQETETYNLKVIGNVSTPVISHSREGDHSNLTCVGKATAYSNYSWWSGDDTWLANGDLLRANKSNVPETGYKCKLRNPVSERTSSTVFEGDLFPPAVPVYCPLNGEVTLNATLHEALESGGITRIEWTFNSFVIALWGDNTSAVYGGFQNRTDLIHETGQISVYNLTAQDDGVYSVRINYIGLAKVYKLKVIARVSKPTITYSCSDKVCVLTCKTENSHNVTYQWWTGAAWIDASVNFTTEKNGRFRCRVSNPVSSETSDYVDGTDWFKDDGHKVLVITLSVIASVVAFIGLGGLLYFKRDTLMKPWNEK